MVAPVNRVLRVTVRGVVSLPFAAVLRTAILKEYLSVLSFDDEKVSKPAQDFLWVPFTHYPVNTTAPPLETVDAGNIPDVVLPPLQRACRYLWIRANIDDSEPAHDRRTNNGHS